MLTPSAVKNAKPKAKPYKLADERGMYLLVRPNGGKLWRFDYRRPGTKKRNTLSLGVYPDVSLKKARERRDEARKKLADGIDVGEQRKAEAVAAAGTFEAVAVEWVSRWQTGKAAITISKVRSLIATHLLPYLGPRPLASIEPPELLACLRRVEATGRGETAHRCKQVAHALFAYGIACGYCTRNPAADIGRALTPARTEHRAAIVKPERFGELLRAMDAYGGSPVVRAGLQLLALTFVRPGELRRAEWVEFDLDNARWEIPAERMKMRREHIVPLAAQAVAILRELHPLTGSSRYVFPSERGHNRPISENTLGAALRTLGYPPTVHVPHGFRSSASTMLNEMGFKPEIIEAQLAHAKKDRIAGIYNRARYLPERTTLMTAWADYLDTLRAGKSKVVSLRHKAS